MRVEHLPDLSSEYARALEDGLVALRIVLPSETRRAIDDHVRLLLAWNGAINLTAIRDPADIARLHVLDSLSALHAMRARGVDEFVDIGSGAGYPGIPLAAMLRPSGALLIESIGKKADFLGVVVDAVGLSATVEIAAARAETVAEVDEYRERWPAVLARAVSGLGDLVELAFPLLRPGGWLVAWKRGEIDAEIDQARRAGDALGGAAIELVDSGGDILPGHRLVLVRKQRPTPAGWPRDPAARRRRPW
jgi:16S rRNA (guanine527-N7)-methyltransferase